CNCTGNAKRKNGQLGASTLHRMHKTIEIYYKKQTNLPNCHHLLPILFFHTTHSALHFFSVPYTVSNFSPHFPINFPTLVFLTNSTFTALFFTNGAKSGTEALRFVSCSFPVPSFAYFGRFSLPALQFSSVLQV